MFSALAQKWNRNRLKDPEYAYLFDAYTGDEVVVYDCETTGLDPKVDEIVSIGAVKIRDNRIVTSQTFEVFLKTTKPISKKSIEIHGIRPVDLANAIEPEEGIRAFLDFIGARPLVGYFLEFDVAMINRYVKPLLGITLPNKQTEVSALYYDKKVTTLPQGNIDLRFDTIMKELRLPTMGKHNAVNDAIMTAMIYIKLQRISKLH